MYQEIIRQKLINARNEIGYTQREVAEKIQEPPSKIAKIETGSQQPDVETLGKLAELYEVSFDWIFGVGKRRNTENFHSQSQTPKEVI